MCCAGIIAGEHNKHQQREEWLPEKDLLEVQKMISFGFYWKPQKWPLVEECFKCVLFLFLVACKKSPTKVMRFRTETMKANDFTFVCYLLRILESPLHSSSATGTSSHLSPNTSAVVVGGNASGMFAYVKVGYNQLAVLITQGQQQCTFEWPCRGGERRGAWSSHRSSS